MKKNILLLFIFILFLSFSSASQTIKVTSLPDSIVEITLIEHASSYMQVIKKLNQTTDKEGKTTFIYEGNLPTEIDIYSRVKRNSYVLFTKKFNSLSTKNIISLLVFPDGTTQPEILNQSTTIIQNVNITQNSTMDFLSNVTNISANQQIVAENLQTQSAPAQLTGAVIVEDSNNNSSDLLKYLFYIIAIGIILGITVFFIYKKNQNRSPPFQHHGKIALKDHSSQAHDLTFEETPVQHHDHKRYSSSNQEFLKLKKQRRMDELKRRMEQDLDEFKRLEKD